MANKKKPARKASNAQGNPYNMLEGMDGNPNSPREWDEVETDQSKFFFVAGENASDADATRVLILNWIHKHFHAGMARHVPAATDESDPNIEILHVEQFHGKTIQVCVVYSPKVEGQPVQCFATIKLADEAPDSSANVGEEGYAHESIKDEGIPQNTRMWVPRFKYIANLLRTSMYEDYAKDGTPKPRPVQPTNDNGDSKDYKPTGSKTEVEETMSVFSGCIGRLIGPKGAKVTEIKAASGISGLDFPKRDEDAPKPRAREPATITLKGTQDNIEKAKKLIQAIVDEWANAPRPTRDGISGSAFYNTTEQTPAFDPYQAPSGDSFEAGGSGDTGGDGSWGDETNAAAAAAASSGDSWEASGTQGASVW